MPGPIPEWKKLEQKFKEYFEQREKRELLVYHRFPDTRAANNFLPAQPADHLVIAHGRPLLIETKYSSGNKSLASCFAGAVSDHQLFFHRLWARAGAYTFILFRGAGNVYELWDGAHCAWVRSEGKRLSGSKPLKSVQAMTWDEGFDALFNPLIITTKNTYRSIKLL